MISYPVYPCFREDYDGCDPIGRAATPRGALRLLRRYFKGTGAGPILGVTCDDKPLGNWGWWLS